jgi:NtrC-family two-component system response regulator AlgB
LFYRLNVIAVTLPPLRTRPSDLLAHAERFLEFSGRQIGRLIGGFAPDARERLLAHPWRGNLRELRNVIERAAILSRGERITAADLFDSAPSDSRARIGGLVSLEALEREHIERVLEISESQEAAARVLGIDPATLYRKRKRWRAQSHA